MIPLYGILKTVQRFAETVPIILQGHMDMVCDKVPDCTIDISKETSLSPTCEIFMG